MQQQTELEVKHAPVQSTYTTDSFRKVKDAETGEVSVKRWVEERQVTVALTLDKQGGRVFHRGARIA